MAGVLLTILRHIQGRPAGGGLPHLGPADPAEFGSVGAFLCSEQASHVTGTAIRCDGGLVRSL